MTRVLLQELHRFHGMHAVLVALAVVTLIWLWSAWDALRHPEQVAALRWYHHASTEPVPEEEAHDLQALSRQFSGELKAARSRKTRSAAGESGAPPASSRRRRSTG
jgi:hypothetical protein